MSAGAVARAAAAPSASASAATSAKPSASAKACDPSCVYNGRCAVLQTTSLDCCRPIEDSVLGKEFAAQCRAQERAQQTGGPQGPRCTTCLGKNADGSPCLLLGAMGNANATPCCEELPSDLHVCGP